MGIRKEIKQRKQFYIGKGILMGLLLYTSLLSAQDTRMAHPFVWKSSNNPAYTGFDGRMNASLGVQRSFWSNPLDFRSYFVAVDIPFTERRAVGLGGASLFFQRDQEGSLMYVTNMLGIDLSVRTTILRNTVLQFGIQPCVYQKSLDASRIVMGDQLDPYYGKILGMSPQLIDVYKDKITLFDFASGLYGRTNFYLKNGTVASVDYGFSMYHIIEPSQSFVAQQGSLSAEENLINRRMSMYLSYAHPIVVSDGLNTVLSPYLMYEKQGVMANTELGVYWEQEQFGLVGISVKKDQYEGMSLSALLFHFGVNLNKGTGMGWKLCYTYEMPTNQGTVYKNTTHALSVHWFFQKNPARETERFEHSPNNTRTHQKKIDCNPRWFGRERKAKVRL